MARSSQHRAEASERSWLELKTGIAPVLLIAPHGGRARPAAPIKSHPKVNDLYTGELTRELAQNLDANAIINRGMDRNRLDCNRVPQLLKDAPWMLSAVADQAERLVRRHGRLAVLIIHGWNVIQARVDFGIGMRLEDGSAPPIDPQRLTASDSFRRNVLLPLARRLDDCGIAASFGLRYPGANKHNLLQAFTGRHHNSDAPSLRRLAELARAGAVEAAQMELSVPLRWPGPLRARALACIEQAMLAWIEGPRGGRTASGCTPGARLTEPQRSVGVPKPRNAPQPSLRYGMEFYDPFSSLGCIASFRFGHDLSRASLLLLCEGTRVVMFSTEDRLRVAPRVLSLGGLQLALNGRAFELRFCGPAIAVPDARYCISVEQALASGRLLEVALSLHGPADDCAAQTGIDRLLVCERVAPRSRFGRTRGRVKLGAAVYTIDACGRVGFGPDYGSASSARSPRRNLWAYLDSAPAPVALETALAAPNRPDGAPFGPQELGSSQVCGLQAFELIAPDRCQPPRKLSAVLSLGGAAQALALAGEVKKFIGLAHGGEDGAVTYTTLGFAALKSRLGSGYGAFWISDRTRPLWVWP